MDTKINGYQGLFLGKKTKEQLISLQKEGLASTIKDMHITFNYGEIDKYSQELMEKEFTVRVVGYASDGKNSGFQIELPEELKPYYKNPNGPHVTVSLGEVDGVKGKAVDTGTLNFEKLEEPFEISAKLGYFVFGKGKIMDNSILEENVKSEISKRILEKLIETKTVVTHFGDDLDNKSAIYALEQFAKENGILGENESLKVERVPAGKVKEGMLNVDTGGHTGSRINEDTIIIDGDPVKGINSAVAELANMGIIEIPDQIVELADTIPNKVSPLESRTGLSLIRNISGEQIFKLASAGLLDKVLTDEQLEQYGLKEEQKKQQEVIDNAVEKVNKYTTELENGEKVVIAPEQILGGAQISYELGANYYASIQKHKEKEGSTFAITAKPGLKLPESIKEFGQELVDGYKEEDGTSGVFLNPNGQMLVAGGFKNPDFAVDYLPEELKEKIEGLFKEYALEMMKIEELKDLAENKVKARKNNKEAKELVEKCEGQSRKVQDGQTINDDE